MVGNGCIDHAFKPLMGTLKLHGNGPLYSSTLIGTPAVDGDTMLRRVRNCRFIIIIIIIIIIIMSGLLHLVQRGGDWPLIAVPNVTAHPSMSSVPTPCYSTYLQCHGIKG